MFIHSTEIAAIDFVLLPSEKDIRDVIGLNRSLIQPSDRQITLSPDGNLPHLSLLMGGLPLNRLELATKELKSLAEPLRKIILRIDKIACRNDCSSLTFENGRDLQPLHEILLTTYGEMLEKEVQREMFNNSTAISESSVTYVNSYRQQSIREHFWPHITLGYGKLPDHVSIPKAITLDKIGIYQLGNHCTCEKKIFTITLPSE